MAIFDLDNTLLAGDSDYIWGEYLADQGVVDGQSYRAENERYYQQYREGKLDIYEFLAFSLKPLSEQPIAKLKSWREEFIQQRIKPLLLPKAYDLIADHRAKGHKLLIITATNRFVTEPIAALYGIDHLLATDPEIRDGHYTGRVNGTACFQDGKITRLQQWLLLQDIQETETWFYSDSHNDLPLLSWVDHPIVVDPDKELSNYAKQKGWTFLSLR